MDPPSAAAVQARSRSRPDLPSDLTGFTRRQIRFYHCQMTVHDIGRLGNQMFEYLALMQAAKQFTGKVCISKVRTENIVP